MRCRARDRWELSLASEGQDQIGEDVIERVAALIDIAETSPRQEGGQSPGDDDVVRQKRTVAQAHAEIVTELAMDLALEQ